MQQAIADIQVKFESVFGAGGKIHFVRSPGRVNLIGEHVDYNDGFVLPMAIEPHVMFACRGREDGVIRIASTVFPQEIVEFSLEKKIERGQPAWANYSRGVAAEMISAGITLTGMDALISNTLPVGGGLSSSAAIEVGTARALLGLMETDIDEDRLALICQKAEHNYALVPCGIMDQMIVVAGRKDHALLLDCRDLTRQFIPLDSNELRVVIVNSMVKHELTGGEYAERRRQCEEGVKFFQKSDPAIRALRDVKMVEVERAQDKMDDVVFRRCRHVVGEIQRTMRFATLLSERQYEAAGELMRQSHNSLRDDYEVSTPELDLLAEEAMKIRGVYGARMTGGGFGGCIVALAQPRAVDALLDHLDQTYHAAFQRKPAGFITTASAGAELLKRDQPG